jgi:hypothetical protein
MKSFIKFNHISKDLSPDETNKFYEFYYQYHRLAKCYKMKYKIINRKIPALRMCSLGLTITGTIVGAVKLNPIILGTITGAEVLIGSYNERQTYRKTSKSVRLHIRTMRRFLWK